MTIVHLNFSFETGGIETMLVDLLNEQCTHAALHLVVVNAQVDDRLLATIDPRVQRWQIGRPQGSRNPLYLLKLNALLHRLRPNVIHCHNHKLVRLLWRSPGRTCLTVHDVRIPTGFFGRYDQLFAISEVVRQDVQERAGLSAERIYNGIPTNAISSRDGYEPVAAFRLVQVSRLQHLKKGQHVLLSALRRLVHEDGLTQLRVEFVGGGESWAYLHQLTEAWDLTDYVTFAGMKTRAELYRDLKNYHLLVQPSLYEGFGLTVVEGMAVGLPVLVSDVDGPMELIGNNRFGWSFRAGDAHHLAEQIRFIIDNYDSPVIREKAVNARQYAREQFDVCQTATHYLAQYQTIVQEA